MTLLLAFKTSENESSERCLLVCWRPIISVLLLLPVSISYYGDRRVDVGLVVRNSAFDMKGTSHVVEFEFKGLNLQAAAGTSMDDMFSATLAAMGKNSQVQ